jgi:hypothetical protein
MALNDHLGVISATGFSVLVGLAGIGLYQLGGVNQNTVEARREHSEFRTEAKMEREVLRQEAQVERQVLRQDIEAVSDKLDTLQENMDRQFDMILSRINTDQADLKKVLISTNIVDTDDVFWAAILHESIWVFPSPDTFTKLSDRGLQLEQATPLLSGFNVLPASYAE